MPRSPALFVIAASLVAVVGCGSSPARVPTTPALRADQCIDEVTRAVVTRGEPHAHCESDSQEDTFTAGPHPSTPGTASAPAEESGSGVSSKLATDIAFGALGVGVIGGTVACALKCPEPLDTVVPVAVGGAVAIAVVVALVSMDWSRFGAFH